MPNSHRLSCAQVNFKPEDRGQSHSQQDVADSHQVPRRCFCFHGSTVVPQCLKVLIEKIYRSIDANDGCSCQRRARYRGLANVLATTTASAQAAYHGRPGLEAPAGMIDLSS
jgi:hypothetical protein